MFGIEVNLSDRNQISHRMNEILEDSEEASLIKAGSF